MILREPWADRPSIINWWIIYSLVSALLALLAVFFVDDVFTFILENDPAAQDDPTAPKRARLMVIGIDIGLVFVAIGMAFGVFLPRSDTTWIFAIIQMGGSILMGGCLCVFGAGPILALWWRPEVRAWFRGEEADEFVETVR